MQVLNRIRSQSVSQAKKADKKQKLRLKISNSLDADTYVQNFPRLKIVGQ